MQLILACFAKTPTFQILSFTGQKIRIEICPIAMRIDADRNPFVRESSR